MVILNWLFEEWRDIPGFEGRYQASSFGRIKSLKWEGHPGKEKILGQFIVKGGYKTVHIHHKNGKRKNYLVHRLIALTFPEICCKHFEGATINHLDENPSNNFAFNLRWCTQAENNLYGNHIQKLSQSLKGKNAKKIIQLNIDGAFIKKWNSMTEIENTINISHSHISQVCNNQRKSAGGFIWKYA